MPSIMRANWINVVPGNPAFAIGTNVCDYFDLGNRQGSDYWLEGQIVGLGEFLFNGRIFIPGVSEAGTLIDNFPKAPAPKGWTKRPRPDGTGYELVSDGKTLFGYRVVTTQIPGTAANTPRCFGAVSIYTAKGELVAESLPDEFRLHRHPATI